MYLLSLLLGCAVLLDLRSHRIPNALVAIGLVAALGAGAAADAAAAAIGGAVVGLLALLPFHAGGGMGAGDVKLMAMSGAFLGPLAAAWAALYSLSAGLLAALLILLARRGLGTLLRRYRTMLLAAAGGHPAYVAPGADEPAARLRFPYALAIAAGTLLAVAVHGMSGGGAWLP